MVHSVQLAIIQIAETTDSSLPIHAKYMHLCASFRFSIKIILKLKQMTFCMLLNLFSLSFLNNKWYHDCYLIDKNAPIFVPLFVQILHLSKFSTWNPLPFRTSFNVPHLHTRATCLSSYCFYDINIMSFFNHTFSWSCILQCLWWHLIMIGFAA